ncbi:hypothetical protein Tco_0537914 [Tanacetum coccineum]
MKKPAVPLPSSSLTLSSAEYGNQFLNDNLDVSLTDVLKDLVGIEIQSMVDVPVHQEDPVVQENSTKEKVDVEAVLKRLKKLEKKVEAMSKINHTEEIKESVQANVMNEVKNQLPKFLPKAVSDYVQPRMERTVRDVLQKNPINLFHSSSTTAESLTKYELKSKLYDMMQKIRSFLQHDNISNLPADSEKEKKKRRRKDTEPSKKNIDQVGSSKKGKAPTKLSTTNKTMNAEESIPEAAMDSKESIDDDVVDAEELIHDDAAPEQDSWFNEMVNAEKDPVTFDDLISSTVDFTKFAKNCLKKDKITKANLEGPTFSLLKGNFRNNIELEYDLV